METGGAVVRTMRAPNDDEGHGLLRAEGGFMLLTILFVVLLVLALGGGGWGHSHYGPWSWSPAGVILVVGVILLLTGHVHFT